MEAIDYREAARRLAVSQRQVERLIRAGQLVKVHRGLVDERSVTLHQARVRRPGRAWDEATAWGVVALLSGASAPWLGPTQRSRLKSSLRSLAADDVVARARKRAVIRRYDGLDSAIRRVATVLVDARAGGTELGLSGDARVDGYVASSELDVLVGRLRLHEQAAGPLTLRATSFDLEVVRTLAAQSHVLAALDLAESPQPRERRAGLDALTTALAGLRRG